MDGHSLLSASWMVTDAQIEDVDERLPPTGESTNTNTTNTSATILLLPPSRHGLKLASLSAVYVESEEDDRNAERNPYHSFPFLSWWPLR